MPYGPRTIYGSKDNWELFDEICRKIAKDSNIKVIKSEVFWRFWKEGINNTKGFKRIVKALQADTEEIRIRKEGKDIAFRLVYCYKNRKKILKALDDNEDLTSAEKDAIRDKINDNFRKVRQRGLQELNESSVKEIYDQLCIKYRKMGYSKKDAKVIARTNCQVPEEKRFGFRR